MKIAAQWKVFDKPGHVIDLIEAELHDISGVEVWRTDSFRDNGNYDSLFKIRGNVDIDDLVDVCEYMSEQGAYPV